MFFKCKCCKGCVVCQDDFNRTAGDTVGNDWNEDVGDWDIVATASGEGALQNTNYPATLTRETSCGTNPASHTITIDFLGTPTPFPRSSSVTVKWTPINTHYPNQHRLYLGERNAVPGAVDDGVFVQLAYYAAFTASIRLGNRVAGVDTWLTDELTIGDMDTYYAGGSTWSSGEPQLQVTLCWESVEFYFGVEMWKSYRKLTTTIETPTGAIYTLTAMAINACDMIPQIEAVEGYARWDDLVWSITGPDSGSCPYCGQCTYAYDPTGVHDLGTWAYTSSGGTFTRNASGDLELTSTTVTWLAQVPEIYSLSLDYNIDWSATAPSFSVSDGTTTLSFSKSLSGEQAVAVTVNGSGASTIYAPLASSSLSICYTTDSVKITVGTSLQEYACTPPSEPSAGVVVFTAGSDILTLSNIKVARTDAVSILKRNCPPCDDYGTPCYICSEGTPATYQWVLVELDTAIHFEDGVTACPTSGECTGGFCEADSPIAFLAELASGVACSTFSGSAQCQFLEAVPYVIQNYTVSGSLVGGPGTLHVSFEVQGMVAAAPPTFCSGSAVVNYSTDEDLCSGDTFTLTRIGDEFREITSVCTPDGKVWGVRFPATITLTFLP